MEVLDYRLSSDAGAGSLLVEGPLEIFVSTKIGGLLIRLKSLLCIDYAPGHLSFYATHSTDAAKAARFLPPIVSP